MRGKRRDSEAVMTERFQVVERSAPDGRCPAKSLLQGGCRIDVSGYATISESELTAIGVSLRVQLLTQTTALLIGPAFAFRKPRKGERSCFVVELGGRVARVNVRSALSEIGIKPRDAEGIYRTERSGDMVVVRL